MQFLPGTWETWRADGVIGYHQSCVYVEDVHAAATSYAVRAG